MFKSALNVHKYIFSYSDTHNRLDNKHVASYKITRQTTYALHLFLSLNFEQKVSKMQFDCIGIQFKVDLTQTEGAIYFICSTSSRNKRNSTKNIHARTENKTLRYVLHYVGAKSVNGH